MQQLLRSPFGFIIAVILALSLSLFIITRSQIFLVPLGVFAVVGVLILIIRDPFYGIPVFLAQRLLVPIFEHATFQDLLGTATLVVTYFTCLRSIGRSRNGGLVGPSKMLPSSFKRILWLFILAILISSLPRMLDFKSFFSLDVQGIEHVNRQIYIIILNSLILSVLVVRLVNTEAKFRLVLDSFVVIGIVLSMQGFLQYFGYVSIDLSVQSEIESRTRLTALTGMSAAATGEHLVLPLAFGMFRLPLERRWRFWFLAIGTCINFFAVLLSITRVAYVALGLAFITFLILSLARNSVRLFSSFLIVGLLVAVIMERTNALERLLQNERLTNAEFYRSSLFDLRVPRWQVGLSAVSERWLTGYGLGSSKEIVGARLPMAWRVLYGSVHNLYLGWLIDTGVIGMVPLLALLILTYKNLYVARKQAALSGDYEMMMYANLLFATFLGASLMYLLDSDPVFDVFFFLVFALAIALVKMTARETRKGRVDSSSNDPVAHFRRRHITAN